MKALVYTGPKQLEIQEFPTPKPQAGEVLIKVHACGICGSDVHGYMGLTGRRIAPMIMGHEFSGEVVGFGDNTTSRFSLGDKVTVQPCISCDECDLCKAGFTNNCEQREFLGAMSCNGAMCEYLCVPERLLFDIPDNLTLSEVALIEAFAVSYSGVKKAGNLTDKNVVIIGGGAIGQLALMAAKAQNPKKIILTDLSETRRKKALTLGADSALDPTQDELITTIKKTFGGELAHVAIECVGIQATVRQALSALAPQGVCVWIGLSTQNVELDMQQIVTRELSIHGTYIYSHEDFGESIRFIKENNIKLEELISAEISLEEAPAMFKLLETDTETYLKCVIKF